MFSNNDNYDLDSAQSKIDNAKRLINLQIQVDALKNVLIAKGIISELDIDASKQFIMNDEAVKKALEVLRQAEQKVNIYKNNPEQHLKDLLKAKMDGTIR